MIPHRLIFIWFGQTFPYGNLLALRSARRGFTPDEILLIVDDPDTVLNTLEDIAPDIRQWHELKIRRADASWFEGLPHVADIAADLFGKGLSPATKANLIRLAALYKLGGIYLDFDTITLGTAENTNSLTSGSLIRDPRALFTQSGFCGAEPLALPASLFASANPLRWAAAGLRLGARQLCAYLPGGWKAFRLIEKFYAPAPNNAILGAEAGHPFLETCFRLMAELPEAARVKRFRLGTHLLQRAVLATATPDTAPPGGPHTPPPNHDRQDGHDMHEARNFRVFPPAHFYPLGPEISAHWFKPGTAARLDEMLRPDTTIVHWYNSVESRLGGGALTRAWVESHGDTAFAELVRRYC